MSRNVSAHGMLDFDGRFHRQGVFWDLLAGASFGGSTAEAVSRFRCRRAGPPARHSGGHGRGARIFFGVGVLSEVSDAIYSLHLHSLAHAPWKQLGSMCARSFCVPKFGVASAPRELWAVLCH